MVRQQMKRNSHHPDAMSARSSLPPVKDGSAPVGPIRDVLAAHPFLQGLKPEHVRLLADSAMRVQYEPGEILFREGDPANRFYLIEQGRVSVESRSGDGAPVTVQVVSNGEVLGWSWLFAPYYWHFDARATELTTAIFFYGTRLREQCEEDHGFGFEMMKRTVRVVIHRLQAARQQLLLSGR
jgi:CRP-like cAMP-binding protein